ncbi:MAG: type II toxin-antitoxin system PemK/MazF family toxin [Methylovulum sp.]|nr:type II toxin-antitoxin system PemK/MazF family toxin [Methylovulum sp.]
MKRGEIWWIDLDPTRGSEIKKMRPGVILTVNALNKARRTVVIVPLSSSAQPGPPIVVATPSAGSHSVAVCDQIRAVDKERFVEKIGELSKPDLTALSSGVNQILGLG